MDPWLVASHLGALHTYEKVLVLLVAFGPFVVLAFVMRYARRRDLAEDESAPVTDGSGDGDLSARPPTT